MSNNASQRVTNIDTVDWAPSQVARWLQEQVDSGEVERVIVVVQLVEDDEPGTVYLRQWSKSTREQLLYMTTWMWRNTLERYFD